MVSFRNISFKNKILISTLLVILLFGVGVTLTSRWVLLPSLTTQLKQRGLGIARSIVESNRGYILTENVAEMTSLLFDTAQLEERRAFITYIFVTDKGQNVLSHTFTVPFPEELRGANVLSLEQSQSIKLLNVHGVPAYDIAVPILEGIYHVGTVHVGLSKRHIDQLVSKITTTLWCIIAAVVVIGFFISHFLSKYISRPVSQLTQVSDEISRGNLDVKPSFGSEIPCWEINNCKQVNCPAYQNDELPCWYVDGTLCPEEPVARHSESPDTAKDHVVTTKRLEDKPTSPEYPFGNWYVEGVLCPVRRPGKFPEKIDSCKTCIVYKRRLGDEIVQLADSFRNMALRLKASEAEMRKSEDKYRTLFDSTPNSIFVLEKGNFRILDVNERALEIYGYEEKELIGNSFMDLGAYQYPEGVLAAKGEEPSARSSVYPKVKHYKRDGTPFYVNVYAIQSRRSGMYGIVAVTVDITESLAKESQLIQASKMSTLGEMASAVAHELNQPLSAIQIGADLIANVVQQDGKGWEDMPEVSRHMKEQVDRAVHIINHLREFGRKADIQKEKVNINKPIEGVFTLLGQQLRLRGIKVVLDLKEDLPPIMGDTNRLEQVFINLVVNARTSMEAKKGEFARGEVESVLTVRSFREDGRVVVTVTDTGTGISDAVKDKIFEPFFTTKEVGKGTGLGLSITYGIVKDYDGTIEVESEPGRGSTFKLTFPACTEGENGAQ